MLKELIKLPKGFMSFKESMAQTARFELAWDFSLTDFESAPL